MSNSGLSTRGKAIVDDEDVSKLQFGRDHNMEGQHGLVIGEVKALLEMRERGHSDNAVYKKTLEYVTTFSRFADTGVCARAREILTIEPKLHDFEVTQIINLCPHEAEEAKALVPSLAGREDEVLQGILNEIASLRRIQA